MARMRRHSTMLWWSSSLLILLGVAVEKCQASVYVDALFAEKVFDSVAYFDFEDTKWSYVEVGDIVEGAITALSPAAFDNYYEQYQQYHESQIEDGTASDAAMTTSIETYENNPRDETSEQMAQEYSLEDGDNRATGPPRFMILEYGASTYSSSVSKIRHVAAWLSVDFVVLILNQDTTTLEELTFWWSHKFPGIASEGLRHDPDKKGAHESFFLAVGIEQGQTIKGILEKYESLDVDKDTFYFGIDGMSPIKGSFFATRVLCYCVVLIIFWHVTKRLDPAVEPRNTQDDDYVQFTGDDLCLGEVQTSCSCPPSPSSTNSSSTASSDDQQEGSPAASQEEGSQHECCICLEVMPVGEQVRILPCMHVFHHECINGWFQQKKYTCPMCKLDLRDYLEERRQVSEVFAHFQAEAEGREESPAPSSWRQRLWERIWPASRTIQTDSGDDSLIGNSSSSSSSAISEATASEGDLELTEDTTSSGGELA